MENKTEVEKFVLRFELKLFKYYNIIFVNFFRLSFLFENSLNKVIFLKKFVVRKLSVPLKESQEDVWKESSSLWRIILGRYIPGILKRGRPCTTCAAVPADDYTNLQFFRFAARIVIYGHRARPFIIFGQLVFLVFMLNQDSHSTVYWLKAFYYPEL